MTVLGAMGLSVSAAPWIPRPIDFVFDEPEMERPPLCLLGRTLAGPYDSVDFLEDRSGIYVVVCLVDGDYWGIDCGEGHAVRSRVATHERRACWARHAIGPLMVAVFYTPGIHKSGRLQIEQDIRRSYDFACGER
jgi:hypothetical protein